MTTTGTPITGIKLEKIRTLRPRRESPFAGRSEQIASQFAQTYGMYPRNFAAFNTMSRFAYPESVSVERLAAASITHNIFFFIDDVFFDRVLPAADYGISDETLLAPEPFLRELMGCFLSGQAPAGASRIHQGLADIGRRLGTFMSQRWLSLMVGAVSDYLSAAGERREVEYRGAGTDFLNMRDLDTGGLQTCMLLEVTNDCELPDHARNDPVLAQMTWLTYRSAAWVNDIISYHKDVILEGSEFNLVYVLMKGGRSFEEAVQEAIRLVNDQIQIFLDLETQLPSWDAETDAIVDRYVSGLKDLMSGNTYWHLTSPRYQHPESPFTELRNGWTASSQVADSAF